ncbi:hypothetical protein Tco_0786732 [Tanacetum coccineum]
MDMCILHLSVSLKSVLRKSKLWIFKEWVSNLLGTKSRKGKDGLLKKINRIMANLAFNDVFVGSHAVFKPYRISDHSPSILNILIVVKSKPKPFKFYNLIDRNESFKEIVKEGWLKQVSGFCLYKVVQKLKHLKKHLRKLLFDKGNLHQNVARLRDQLYRVQSALDIDPFNVDLREEEATTVVAFNEVVIMEERFLKQKAKINWLSKGDANTTYFHKAVRSHVSRSRIDVITSADGNVYENEKVADIFVSHYEQFLGQAGHMNGFHKDLLFNYTLDDTTASEMVRPVTMCEVKDVVFSMGNEKSSGPDGYTAAFFKEAWDIVADDIVDVVHEFFTNGKLLKELNHSIIALIPKITANRIKESLKTLAYDTVDWDFLKEVLVGFGFHSRMVMWIMECVSTTSFSICINGSLHGYFKGKRGLHQGDPLSPYLFTLVMEILTLMLHRRVRNTSLYTYYRYCSKLKLINLCFADDLFLFAHGDVGSASIIKDALEEFNDASGLISSLPKSTTYFCNVLNHVKLYILNILPFEEGQLPVKYLGVPLVSSRLMFKDCKELIEKVQSRVQDWKNKSHSAAGRLQLVKSVISSMHIYWASVFVLPSRVLLDIEQIMIGWAWSKAYRSIQQRFNGLAHMEASFFKGVSLGSMDSCLQIARSEFLGDSNFCGNMLWGWRKVLQLSPIIREFICYTIGDGFIVSLWYDHWCSSSPLSDVISIRDIFRVGLDLATKVWDVVSNHAWDWPTHLIGKYPFIGLIPVPFIQEDAPDHLEWEDRLGRVQPFSVSVVWNSIRLRDSKIDWCDVVWFTNHIPRHAFNLWLIKKKKLKTKDMIYS